MILYGKYRPDPFKKTYPMTRKQMESKKKMYRPSQDRKSYLAAGKHPLESSFRIRLSEVSVMPR